MSGRSSWCFTDDHPGCRYAACTCACHAQAPDEDRAEAPAPSPAPTEPAASSGETALVARPVPPGTQTELGFPDGLDGSTDGVATVPFSFRGQLYEVDLSPEHRQELQAALAPFIAAARTAGQDWSRTRPPT